MSLPRRLLLWLGGWVAAISVLHLSLNLDWKSLLNDRLPPEVRKFNVAYIPVT